MRTGVMRITLAVAVLLAVMMVNAVERHNERKVGGGVKFAVNPDHTLRPMMGVDFEVEQEAGPVTDGSLKCDVIARIHDVVDEGQPRKAYEAVLKCDGGRVFLIKRYWFR